jgi:ABC-2 type transport system permease protein
MSALNIAEEMSVALPERADTATTHHTRPFLWSIRRELWENPSIFIAPLAVAAVEVFSFLVAAVRFGKSLQTSTVMLGASVTRDGHLEQALRQERATAFLAVPFVFIAIALVLTMVLVAVFYSLDALYSERRDRSIFFWKSLPVSDRTTVAAKIAVPMVVAPVATLAIAVAAGLVLLLLGSLVFLAEGVSLKLLWTQPLPTIGTVLAYTLIATTLWYAPIYAWLLLVSAWVKRAALVWAVLPFVLLALFEKIAFHTRHLVDLLKYRVSGQFLSAFVQDPTAHNSPATTSLSLSVLTPARFLASPGLWTGLIFAALALILIIRLRRSSDPI